MKKQLITMAALALFLSSAALAEPGPRAVCTKQAREKLIQAKKDCRTQHKTDMKARNECFRQAENAYKSKHAECKKKPYRATQKEGC